MRGKKVSAETQNLLTLFSFRSDGTLLYTFVQKFKKTKKGGPIMSLDPFYFFLNRCTSQYLSYCKPNSLKKI